MSDLPHWETPQPIQLYAFLTAIASATTANERSSERFRKCRYATFGAQQKNVTNPSSVDLNWNAISGGWGKIRSDLMPSFDPKLIKVMRRALEDVMTMVPREFSTDAAKAYLAECILKAAAQGHTNYNELVAAANNQIQTMISFLA
jgi:hypothetical protein